MIGEMVEERRVKDGIHIWVARDPATNAIIARFTSNDSDELDKMVQMWKDAETARTKQLKLDPSVSS